MFVDYIMEFKIANIKTLVPTAYEFLYKLCEFVRHKRPPRFCDMNENIFG